MKASWRITGIGMMLSLVLGIGGSLAWSKSKSKSGNSKLDTEHTVVAARPTHVSALGTIAPRGRIRHVAAPSNFSRVGRLMVDEGDRVTRGQLLAHSDDHQLRVSELEQAETQVCIAQSKLDKLLAGPDLHEVNVLAASISSAKESLEQRNREYGRASMLAKSNSISQEELEDTRLRVTVATLAIQELEAKQSLLQSVREEDVRVLRAELNAAGSRVATVKQNLAMSEIVSPIDGVVLRVHVRDGERPGELGILELGDTSLMQVIAEVYEADAVRLRVGAAARVMLKSSNQQLHGTLTHVRPVVGRKSVLDNDPVSDADARVVEAVIDLTAEDCLLVQSLSNAAVTAIIRVDEP
jgi:HlyD family secretion protein